MGPAASADSSARIFAAAHLFLITPLARSAQNA